MHIFYFELKKIVLKENNLGKVNNYSFNISFNFCNLMYIIQCTIECYKNIHKLIK